jgi:hypothetical protein
MWLTLCTKDQLQLLDSKTGKVGKAFDIDAESLAFSHDGKRIAVAQARSKFLIWSHAVWRSRLVDISRKLPL